MVYGHWQTSLTTKRINMDDATVGQWGQLAPTEVKLWGQNYVFVPTEVWRARSEQYNYSKITTARSNNLTMLSGSCSPVERTPGLSNGRSPDSAHSVCPIPQVKGNVPVLACLAPPPTGEILHPTTGEKPWRRPLVHALLATCARDNIRGILLYLWFSTADFS